MQDELIILPLRRPELFQRGNLAKPVKGALLYGPPGTGKTMLAKALAKESGACFINVRVSALQVRFLGGDKSSLGDAESLLGGAKSSLGDTLRACWVTLRARWVTLRARWVLAVQSKWFGDAQKLVTAVFTLAWKLQPCIIFIDEVDSFLGQRKSSEHETVTNMKTEFMSLWDGFLTDDQARVMVRASPPPLDFHGDARVSGRARTPCRVCRGTARSCCVVCDATSLP